MAAVESGCERVAVAQSEPSAGADSELRFDAGPERSGEGVLRLRNDSAMPIAYKQHTFMHVAHGGGGGSATSASSRSSAAGGSASSSASGSASGSASALRTDASVGTSHTDAMSTNTDGAVEGDDGLGTAVGWPSAVAPASSRLSVTATATGGSRSATTTAGGTASGLLVRTATSADDHTAIHMECIDALDSRTQSMATASEGGEHAEPERRSALTQAQVAGSGRARRVSFVSEPPAPPPLAAPAKSFRHRLAQWMERSIRGHGEPTNEELSLRTVCGTMSRGDASKADTLRRRSWRNRLADTIFGPYADADRAAEGADSRSRSRSQRKDKSSKRLSSLWSRLRALFTRRPAAVGGD